MIRRKVNKFNNIAIVFHNIFISDDSEPTKRKYVSNMHPFYKIDHSHFRKAMMIDDLDTSDEDSDECKQI